MNSRRLSLLGLSLAVVLAAACGGKSNNPGIPVTGKLNAAQGGTAPLTLSPTNPGIGFSMTATLGSAQIVGQGAWVCFAPDPPSYPHYDLQATDNATFALFISVDPTAWTPGHHAIDGNLVSLLVEAPDRFGTSTSGELVLTMAGLAVDTAGSNCVWYIIGVVLLFGKQS